MILASSSTFFTSIFFSSSLRCIAFEQIKTKYGPKLDEIDTFYTDNTFRNIIPNNGILFDCEDFNLIHFFKDFKIICLNHNNISFYITNLYNENG